MAVTEVPELVPARTPNEYAYCPRLFFLEWVDQLWAPSSDTAEGDRQHRRVDAGGGAAPLPAEGEVKAARSVELSSERLGDHRASSTCSKGRTAVSSRSTPRRDGQDGTAVRGARGLATRGCEVTGLDSLVPLMEQAAELDSGAGAVVKYVNAAAEETGLAAAEFDLVTAGQCWHWFDRPRAAAEARRVLKPGGRLAIAHFDWIALPGSMTEATEKLIEKHNPKWKFGGGLGIYPLWPRDMAVAGFANIETFSFDLDAIYTHEAWRGDSRKRRVGASLAPEGVAALTTSSRDAGEWYPEGPDARATIARSRLFGVAP